MLRLNTKQPLAYIENPVDGNNLTLFLIKGDEDRHISEQIYYRRGAK